MSKRLVETCSGTHNRLSIYLCRSLSEYFRLLVYKSSDNTVKAKWDLRLFQKPTLTIYVASKLIFYKNRDSNQSIKLYHLI